MPIRIPNLNASSRGPMAPGISPSDAMKPGLALGSVARGLGKAAETLHKHDIEIMEAENAADLMEFKTEAKTAYANRQASFAEDHDYLNYGKKWEGDLQGLQKALSERKYSAATLEKARLFLTEFEGSSKIGVASAAQRKALERKGQAFKNSVAQIEENYDPSTPEGRAAGRAMFEDALGDMSGLTPEQKDSIRMQVESTFGQRDRQAEIYADPHSFLKRKKPEGVDSYQWDQEQREAQRLIDQRGRNQADSVLDAIYSGTLTNPDDIEALTPDLGAKAQFELKQALAGFSEGKSEAKLRDPRFQNQNLGEIAKLLSDYRFASVREDFNYVGIAQRIRRIADPDVKKFYADKLEEIKDGREAELRTVKDWAMKKADEYFSSNQFGDGAPEKPKGRSLDSFLADGFLLDRDKMQRFGWSESHAEQIAKAAEAQREANRTGKRRIGPDPLDLVRELWNEKNAPKEDFPEIAREVFEAIRNGKTGSFIFEDQDKVIAYKKALTDYRTTRSLARGRAMAQILGEFRLDPDMDMTKAKEMLDKLEIEIGAGETGSNWDPHPNARTFAAENLLIEQGIDIDEGEPNTNRDPYPGAGTSILPSFSNMPPNQR